MSEMKSFEVVGSFNAQRITNIDPERTVNMFEYIDPEGKKPRSLINTSGLTDSSVHFDESLPGFRAQFVALDAMFVVIGSSVFRLTQAVPLTASFIGTLENTTTGYVGVEANTSQVIFVDGVDGYIWQDGADTFTKITDTSFPAQPIDVAFLDGFFIVAAGETNTFQLSSLNQGVVWGNGTQEFTVDTVTDIVSIASTDNFQTGVEIQFSTTGTLPAPLNTIDSFFAIMIATTQIRVATTFENAVNNIFIDITTAGTPVNTVANIGILQLGAITSHPGTIVACRTLHRRLFLFSRTFTEVWENAGVGTNLPFRRNNSLLMEFGTPSRASVVSDFDRLLFLSEARGGLSSIREVKGSQALSVSTTALDYEFSQFSTAGFITQNDPAAFLIKENGLIFYRLNFTLANKTYVLNISMSNPQQLLWHEEEVLNGDRHPAQTHAFFNGINYVGDYKLPNLYRISPTLYTNDGEHIRRMRITAPVGPGGYQRTRVDRFHLDLLQGDVDQLEPETEIEIDLLTEDNHVLETEAEDNIILENGIISHTHEDVFVFLSVSKDGGQTFGYRNRMHMGATGERSFRTVWRKLGIIPRGQYFVTRIEFFNAVPFVILGAAWAIEVLPD